MIHHNNVKSMDENLGIPDRGTKIKSLQKAIQEIVELEALKGSNGRAKVDDSHLEAKIRSLAGDVGEQLYHRINGLVEEQMIVQDGLAHESTTIKNDFQSRSLRSFDSTEYDKAIAQKKSKEQLLAETKEKVKFLADDHEDAKDNVRENGKHLSSEEKSTPPSKTSLWIGAALISVIEGGFVFSAIQEKTETMTGLVIGGVTITTIVGVLFGTKGLAEALAKMKSWLHYVLPGFSLATSFGVIAWLRGLGPELYLTMLNLILIAIALKFAYGYFRRAFYHKSKALTRSIPIEMAKKKAEQSALETELGNFDADLKQKMERKRDAATAQALAPLEAKMAKGQMFIDNALSHMEYEVYRPINTIYIQGIQSIRFTLEDAKEGVKSKSALDSPIKPLTRPDILSTQLQEEETDEPIDAVAHAENNETLDHQASSKAGFNLNGVINGTVKMMALLFFAAWISACSDRSSQGLIYIEDQTATPVESDTSNTYSAEDIATFALDVMTDGDFDHEANKVYDHSLNVFASVIDDRQYHTILNVSPLPAAKSPLLEVQAKRIKAQKAFFHSVVSLIGSLPRPPTRGFEATNMMASISEAITKLRAGGFDDNTVLIHSDGFNYPGPKSKDSPANLYTYHPDNYEAVAGYFDAHYPELNDLSYIDRVIFFYFPSQSRERETTFVRDFWVRYLESKGTEVTWRNTIPRSHNALISSSSYPNQ